MNSESPEVQSSGGSMFAFAVTLVITGCVIAFFAYKLIKSLRDKERMKQEKKELKEKRKEKDQAKRMKKK